MTKHRINARIDNNQNEIVKALRQIPNLSVQVGHDDILIGHKGKTYWFEIKSPQAISKRSKKPLSSAIKPSQLKLLSEWQGHYKIVHNLDQILREIGL